MYHRTISLETSEGANGIRALCIKHSAGPLKMASNDSYAVTVTAKCGQEIIFSHVKCVNLNENFAALFDLLKRTDGAEIETVQIGAGPNGPWHTVEKSEGMGSRHV